MKKPVAKRGDGRRAVGRPPRGSAAAPAGKARSHGSASANRGTSASRTQSTARPVPAAGKQVASTRRAAGGAPEVRVHLNRALSKRGILTRSQATEAILAGRVSVNGRLERDPAARVSLERARIEVDQQPRAAAPWRTLLLNKPRGIVTTKTDPQNRPTVYSLLPEDAGSLVPVGRLDLATPGLLIMTTDTELAGWLTDPSSQIPRVYVVTVRGRVTAEAAERMQSGEMVDSDLLAAASVVIRKVSDRESHLTLELREGKNREVRRLCEAVGHEVIRLRRVSFGGLSLGDLAPGAWQELSKEALRQAFPAAPLR